jgi:hypothetical protein
VIRERLEALIRRGADITEGGCFDGEGWSGSRIALRREQRATPAVARIFDGDRWQVEDRNDRI